jgi:hypothetical protein
MRSIQEIIYIEDRNKGEIHLHKEGPFWKAYQQSAYLIIREVKTFNVSKKMEAAIGREVVSLSIPQNALNKYFSKEQLTEIKVFETRNDTLRVLEEHLLIPNYSLQKEDYQQWLKSIPFVFENTPQNIFEKSQQTSHPKNQIKL